jgi:hypothetical protein
LFRFAAFVVSNYHAIRTGQTIAFAWERLYSLARQAYRPNGSDSGGDLRQPASRNALRMDD